MKSTKTKFAKKLKSIKAGDYLKQDRILQVLSAADGLVDLLPKITTDSIRKIPWKLEEKPIDESEREASGSFVGDKENLRPLVNQNAEDSRDRKEAKPEISSSSDQGNRRTGFGFEFRRPDSNSSSLFDPKLLEAFEKAVLYYRRLSEIDSETRALEEDDITFPEITDGDRRPEVGRECQGKDCFTLPATVSDCANQEDGEKRTDADEKDKNDRPNSLLAEAIVEDKDDNMLGQRRTEGTLEKDDNALSGISSDIESTAGADEEAEGGRKDDNALSGKSSDIESTAGADEEAGGRKDDNALSRISGVIESTAGADEEAEGGKKDDNTLSGKSSDIESTAGADEEAEGGRKDDNTLSGISGVIESTAGADEEAGRGGGRKDDNTLPGISSDIESTAGADEEAGGGGGKDDNVLSGISSDIESTAGADEEAGRGGGRKDDNTLSGISGDIESTAGADEEAGGGGRKDDNALSGISSDIESTAGADEEVEGGRKDDNALADPLLGFEERCPPGGEDSVVLYTTTLRGIRKTFDDCNKVRFLLDSFKVSYYERDVSMHREYREELQRIAAEGTAELPVLFVKGRCVGGANKVLSLHEQGKLKGLFDGVPIAGNNGCEDCGGIRFLMCKNCRGSRKIVWKDGRRIECGQCNENGLIVCSSCSSSS